MKIKLNQLRNIVKNAMNDEKLTENLRNETKKVLGPIMNTNVGLVDLVEAINNRIDVLERTGRDLPQFKPSLIMKFANSSNSEVRAMVARVLPENLLGRFVNDASSKVRVAAAKRMNVKMMKEMVRKFPTDDELRLIYSRRVKAITEANITSKDEFDIHGDEPLGDSSKTYEVELSEEWYRNKAACILDDYSKNRMLDYSWEERAVNSFCNHTKATSGVVIDKTKLLEAVKKLIEERDDATLKRVTSWDLRMDESHDPFGFDVLNEHSNMDVFPIFEENVVDPVKQMVKEGSVEKFNVVFSVIESRIPHNIQRRLMGENYETRTSPITAKLPHGNGIRSIDEQALDMFVESWNKRQKVRGEPFKISWQQDTSETFKIQFQVTLR